MIINVPYNYDAEMNTTDNSDKSNLSANSYCKNYIRGCCARDNCRFVHEIPQNKSILKELFRFCHDFQNKVCFRANCKFVHATIEDEDNFYASGRFPSAHRNENQTLRPIEIVQEIIPVHVPPPTHYNWPQFSNRDEDCPPEAKFRRFAYEDSIQNKIMPPLNVCYNCESLEHKVKLLHENISVLLKKVTDLSEKNEQLTSMNEFLLEQTASLRNEHSCMITSRHGNSAPVSLATVSVTPVVSLARALPTLVPTAATPNLALAPTASSAQLLTPAPQLLTVSTTQQLVGNSGALIVTSAGAQQLMQVSDSGTLMGAGQTVVAVTPAQLTLAQPAQQLIGSTSQNTVQQLVQQSALQPQLPSQQFATQQSVQHLAAAQRSAQHLAVQQSAQHLAAQQSAQHLAAQQSAQHLAAQQSAQCLAAQQSAQHLAVQQSAQQQLAVAAQQSAQQQLAAQQSAQQQLAAQQQLVPPTQQLVHQTSTQQITISSTSQPMALPISQAQPISFPLISQNIIPH